jgi:hypothetical protein
MLTSIPSSRRCARTGSLGHQERGSWAAQWEYDLWAHKGLQRGCTSWSLGDRHGPALGLAVGLQFRMAAGTDMQGTETGPLEDSSPRHLVRAWSMNRMGCRDLPWLISEVGIVFGQKWFYMSDCLMTRGAIHHGAADLPARPSGMRLPSNDLSSGLIFNVQVMYSTKDSSSDTSSWKLQMTE